MYIKIGKRIRRLRKNHHLTQEQLAEMVNISPSFMGHIERGTRVLSVDTLCKIAVALNCSTDMLLGVDLPREASSISDDLAAIIADLQALKRRFK